MVVSTHQRRRYIQAREKPGTTKYRSHSKKKWFTILVDCFFFTMIKYKSEKYRRSYR